MWCVEVISGRALLEVAAKFKALILYIIQESAAAKEKSRKDYQDSLLTQAERKQKK